MKLQSFSPFIDFSLTRARVWILASHERWILHKQCFISFTAKKPAPRLPLTEIGFRRHVINKPMLPARPRQYDPCEKLEPLPPDSIKTLQDDLKAAFPALHALRYLCPSDTHPPAAEEAPDAQVELQDTDDLWSEPSQEVIQNYLASMKPLPERQIAEICAATMGQANNKQWFVQRTGRLTASAFKRICCCTKPVGLLKTLLYPSDRAVSEAMVYGRDHEKDAVAAYVQLMRSMDVEVEVFETGLHIHKEHPLLAASPDRLVRIDGGEGLLEVKCLPSKKGMTVEDACKDRKFCCALKDGVASLKTNHEYYYQVQGQMAVTGHMWCDFAIWTEGEDGSPANIHVERISFNQSFWQNEMLPALHHFMLHAFIPELLTQRIRRLGVLYTSGAYVSFKKVRSGFFVSQPAGSLKLKIKKLM